MSVDTQQVRHIAKLARIAMSDAEVEAMVPELNNILGWVEQLGEVNTEGLEPLTAVLISINKKYKTHSGVRISGV